MTQESMDDADRNVAPQVVVFANVVETSDGQTSEALRRIIPPSMTTVRTATFQTTTTTSTETSSDDTTPPKIVIQTDEGEHGLK